MNVESDFIMGKLPEVSALMQKEVLTIMTGDDITDVATSDPTIIALGEEVLRRNIDNEIKRKYYSSQRMRDAARLKLKIQEKLDKEIEMNDALRPSMFDTCAEAALEHSMLRMDDSEDLAHPSYAIKMKYSLRKMAHYKKMNAMKKLDEDRTDKKSEEEKQQAEEFLFFLAEEWSIRVNRIARKVLKERQEFITKHLPKPGDMKKLSEYIVSGLKAADYKDGRWNNYHDIENLAQARLTQYNKRRAGEIDGLKYVF